MADDTDFTGSYEYDLNGVIIPDTDDVLETVQNEFKEALGSDISLEESTPQGRLIEAETNARIATIRFNAEIANILINISTSAGIALDAWGANFNVERNGALASTCEVYVTGIPDTVIPAGSQASTQDGGIWLSESEIVIGGDGTAEGTFYSAETGEIELEVGALNIIVAGSTTGVNGWETIVNTTAAELGCERESDTSYKARILACIFSGTALFGNYASACYKVDGVTDVYTLENPYGDDLEFDNITIPAHSVYVCVDGGSSEDVALALYQCKSAGCGWCGNTTVTVTDPDYNTLNTVIYQTPDSVNIVIEIYLSVLTNSSDDLESDVKEVITAYASGDYAEQNYNKLGIRALLSPYMIAGVLNTNIEGINVNKVLIGLETPAPHAVSKIFKASVTSGITHASVNTDTFSSAASGNGVYNFTYDGENWLYDDETADLDAYGITYEGDALTGDIIQITYASGDLAQNEIILFADETAVISEDNITVNING